MLRSALSDIKISQEDWDKIFSLDSKQQKDADGTETNKKREEEIKEKKEYLEKDLKQQ